MARRRGGRHSHSDCVRRRARAAVVALDQLVTERQRISSGTCHHEGENGRQLSKLHGLGKILDLHPRVIISVYSPVLLETVDLSAAS